MPEHSQEGPRYASDLVVDFLAAAGFEYISLNPGSSFRGLHDSLVNYRPDAPVLIECTHEKTAVGLAHGYAKASGRPMAVAVHDLVGLMQSTMGVYMAHVDRTPVFLLGGSGPMDESKRRPWIDWMHSADTENQLVRDFTTWDEHPVSVEGLWPALTRANRIMRQQPSGPVYVALDSALQEEPLPGGGLGNLGSPAEGLPTGIGAAPGELEELLERIDAAERPVLIPGYLGSRADTFADLQFLAERLGLGVFDPRLRLGFPSTSPWSLPDRGLLDVADLVVLVDLKDPAHKTGVFKKEDTTQALRVARDATVVSIGLHDLGRARWANDGGLLLTPDRAITAEGALAVSQLRRLVELQADEPQPADRRRDWGEQIAAARARRGEQISQELQRGWDERPVATRVLAAETWKVIRDYDWVLAAGTLNDRVEGVWDFDRPYRHPGRSLGTATQFAIALGVALAHRDAGRLVVSLQPDGDLLFDLGGMWTASHYRLPLLCVMFNNRSYYNDWAHQLEIARLRGRDTERAWMGLSIDEPAPDFAEIAGGFGWHAEGPIDDPGKLVPAIRRAAEAVMTERRPALVDVVCQVQ